MDLPNPTEIATPLFTVLIIVEMIYAYYNKKIRFEPKDTVASMLMGTGSVVANALGAIFIVQLATWTFQFHLFEIPNTIWAFALCFILHDLAYYALHRAAHRVRWFWASHIIHHSSQHYNLSTALRQTWTSPLSITFIFLLPLFYIGFPPEMVAFTIGINLIYQFWIHTEAIDKMGPLEWVLNTPSHHRVHHSTNPIYLDSNYAGAFIIWDRMFGTFVAERDDQPCKYGIVSNIATYNPFKIAFHEWISMIKDIAGEKNYVNKLKYLLLPPGWTPDGSRKTTELIKKEWHERQATTKT